MPATDSRRSTVTVPEAAAVPLISTGSARSTRATAGGVAPATWMPSAAVGPVGTAGCGDGHSTATSTISTTAASAVPASCRSGTGTDGGRRRCARPCCWPVADSSGSGTREAWSRSTMPGDGRPTGVPDSAGTRSVTSTDSSPRPDGPRRTDDSRAVRTAGERSRTASSDRSSQPGPNASDAAAATDSANCSALAGLRSGSRASPRMRSQASPDGTSSPGNGGSAAS